MTPTNQQSLIAYLAANWQAVQSQTDAQLAAQPGWSSPTYTPRQGQVTLATLSQSAVWGFSKASSFQAALNANVAAGQAAGATQTQQQAGAESASLLALLSGPGFDCTDPQVGALAQTFVTLSNGTINATDASVATGVPTYVFAEAVQASDVTTARAIAATRQSSATGRQQAAASYNALVAMWDQYDTAASADPTTAKPTVQQAQSTATGPITGGW